MKIIVPMAGRGSRLRPHTVTVPKPLIPVAGKPIVHRLVEDIVKILKEPIEEIAFILGDEAFFGNDIVKSLEELAQGLGARASIYRQDLPLGTGHAIMCAKESLSGPAVIAYADTLIRANFDLDPHADAVIWVKQVEFVSDLAVIGIYYFKEVGDLKKELQNVLDNNIQNGGEYQINDGIKAMMANGKVFKTGSVDEWMDCGNKNVTVETNSRMLGFLHKDNIDLVAKNVKLENATIIPPCYIGDDVILINATVGPNVSLGKGCHVIDSTIKNSLVQTHVHIKNANLDNAMIGNHVRFDGKFTNVSIGDYSVFE
jgi:glucose-1-phosphate thymidylyltransferase